MASDDCQIFAVLGLELLSWGKVTPDLSQFPIFYRPEGSGYVEQCPWAEMKITALPPGKPDMDNIRYFTEPAYSDDGQSATVHFVTQLVARDAKGQALPPYMNQVNLRLKKVDGRWELIAKEQGPFT